MAGSTRATRDAQLLAALVTGLTVEAAAKKAGMSERTVYRRLQDAAFKREIEEARGELVTRTMAALCTAGLSAVATLVQLLSSPLQTVRLGAARAIIELGTKLREHVELDQRLRRIEDQVF